MPATPDLPVHLSLVLFQNQHNSIPGSAVRKLRKETPVQPEITLQPEAGALREISPQARSAETDDLFRAGGVSLIVGAVGATVFNLLFPRADDPANTAAVLAMMTENETMRQVTFLGVTAALWIITVGISGICWSITTAPAVIWARLGLWGALIGAGIFTVASGIGMVATGAATEWMAAGADLASVEFAVAAALNAADDGVWFMSIIVYWGALGMVGVAMLRSGLFPRWLSTALLVFGFANVLLAGVPLAVGGPSAGLMLVFAAIAQLTIVWALVAGIWMLRSNPSTIDR
jgi:hypothetical protein